MDSNFYTNEVCIFCDGKGEVIDFPKSDYRNSTWHIVMKQCEFCNGTGKDADYSSLLNKPKDKNA
jgi:hypothetical protein